jgi:uncharacterized membrane protein
MATLAYVGYILALIGGIIIVIWGLIGLLGSAFLVFSPLAFIGGTVYSIVEIILGILCIIGSRYVSTLIWGIILLILGIIAGNLGGSLVVLGAIIGLISTLIKSAPPPPPP